MKFIAIGSTKGDIDIVNRHIEKSKADVVLCTGDFGVFYRTQNPQILPKYFQNNNFYQYLEGQKHFIKPIYIVRGPHDNIGLCKKLSNNSIKIHNFHLIDDGTTVEIENNTKDNLPVKNIIIGGIGGSYSPKYYYEEKLIGNARRHFTHEHVESISSKNMHILLLHDLIGNCTKKQIEFSSKTLNLIRATAPMYCLGGKYHWWGNAKVHGTNFVLLPYAEDGYLSIDTNDDWNADGVKFELRITK